MRVRALAAALLVAGCSKVNQDNFAKVRDGMSEQEVVALLGKPDESSSVSVIGISGTSSKWMGDGAVISIHFVNGKVRLKSFDKPPAK